MDRRKEEMKEQKRQRKEGRQGRKERRWERKKESKLFLSVKCETHVKRMTKAENHHWQLSK